MIENTLSFGIFMLAQNVIILALIADLMRRTGFKLFKTRHRHVTWNGGVIFMAYLMCVFAFNVSETYTCFVNYIVSTDPISLDKVAARVFSRSILLIAKSLLWYYSVKCGFVMFKKD